MEHSEENESAAASDKLIPEWSRNADDQVVLAGIAVAALFFGILGWNTFIGGDDEDLADSVATTTGAENVELVDQQAEIDVSAQIEDVDLTGDLQAAVSPLAGTVTGVGTGSVAVLEGFVANEEERAEAETAALGVAGIESVDNKLELLEPSVISALEAEGVDSPSANGVGTVITVGGIVESEAKRAEVLDAAGNVAGVTEVVDQLTIPVQSEPEIEPEPEVVEEQVADIADQLNVLPQVQFGYNSTVIDPGSFSELDKAVALLSEVDESYDGTIEVQGYTDTTGDAATNQKLSEGRAQAVTNYLIEKGVPESLLVYKGYGPTTEFGPNLEDNRLVRFEPAG